MNVTVNAPRNKLVQIISFVNMIRITSIMLIFLLYHGIIYGNIEEKDSCIVLLPPDIQTSIHRTYNNWQILSSHDLLPDDQALWEQSHKSECPGITFGKYTGREFKEYAVLLIQKEPKKRTKLIIIKKDQSNRNKIEIIYNEASITNYPVIYTNQSGRYHSFYNDKKTITVETDVVVYEHPESRAVLFYYQNGKYHQLLISD